MNICDKLDYFFETLISEKNFSLNSVDAYKRDLMQLFKNDSKFNLTVINENYIVQNLNSLKEKQTSNRSIARKISCYKNFFKFALEENWINNNPCLKLKNPSSGFKYMARISSPLASLTYLRGADILSFYWNCVYMVWKF